MTKLFALLASESKEVASRNGTSRIIRRITVWMKREEVVHAQRARPHGFGRRACMQAEARQSKGALSVRRRRLGRLRCGEKGWDAECVGCGMQLTGG